MEVKRVFAMFSSGYENALKDYYKQQISRLNKLITLLLGSLTKGERQKVMTICTVDVHSRDVVSRMILQKVFTSNNFIWQSQLRHRQVTIREKSLCLPVIMSVRTISFEF